jgi:hypothetical protein
MAVVQGCLTVTRLQTFAEVWWWLLRCLLGVVSDLRRDASE